MFINWQTVVAVGIGGSIGSIFRLYAVHFSNKYYESSFPIGVLIVNIFGSLIIGILFAYISSYEISNHTKALFTTGLLGGLTTFSTFALDSYLLLNTSLSLALLNIFLNVAGSIFAVFIGFKIASLFVK